MPSETPEELYTDVVSLSALVVGLSRRLYLVENDLNALELSVSKLENRVGEFFEAHDELLKRVEKLEAMHTGDGK